MIISTVERNRDKPMSKIHKLLDRKGVKCSLRTLYNRTKEFGIQSLSPIQKPLLTDGHRQKRFQWDEAHINFNFNQVIFTDETTFSTFNNVKRI